MLVFDHLSQPGTRIDEETIQSIHAAVGDKVGSRFFIIARVASSTSNRTTSTWKACATIALRIPYSFINELHHREFTALKQPSDETDVNAIVDAVGFDFIRPPQVTWTSGIDEPTAKAKPGEPTQQAYIQVEAFESRAYIRGQDTHGGLETLSLVLIDLGLRRRSLCGRPGALRRRTQGQRLAHRLAPEQVGVQNMVVFIDIYGNEAREIVRPEHFGLPTPAPVTPVSEGA